MMHSKYVKANRLHLNSIKIDDEFWNKRLKMNNEEAIFYQWEQLEKTHNQDNFRVLAGEKEGYRFGFFYCDSDLHKWMDAAARILTTKKNDRLKDLVHEYIDLMAKVQKEDGYLYTYNQFHFPDKRWINIQIEHELYCLGHLIEAAVSFMEANDSTRYRNKLLGIAIKAADLLVEDFQKVHSINTPGHQEIEIALIRLYRYSKDEKYLKLAERFLYQRGKSFLFGFKLIRQTISQGKRTKFIEKDMQKRNIEKTVTMDFFGGETKHQKEAPLLSFRSSFQYLTGRYSQQNQPIRRMKRPFGHSVRWGYLATAMAMLYQENGDSKLLKGLQRTWQHLVQKQMFITGGIGALGAVEGFGRDYELDSSYCYCETYAAIASILLNWELALITNEAKYSDLLEWQLYNALSVGIALDGKSYLYRNLLESNGQLSRKEWFTTPCCPSNISRIWANIGEYIYSYNEDAIWIHQYIGNSTKYISNDRINTTKLEMKSKMPWEGEIQLNIHFSNPQEKTIYLRIPSWTSDFELEINGESQPLIKDDSEPITTGSGFSPNNSYFYPIKQEWLKSNQINLKFNLQINTHKAHPKVKSNSGKIAFSRGPLVYCFESIDNIGVPIPNAILKSDEGITYDFDESLFGGIVKLIMQDNQNQQLVAIPYFNWANRNESKMQIWIKN